MNDDEALLLVLFGVLLVAIFVLGLVATLANGLASLLLELGAPASVAGEFGAIIFAGISLGIFLVIIKTALS